MSGEFEYFVTKLQKLMFYHEKQLQEKLKALCNTDNDNEYMPLPDLKTKQFNRL